MATKAKMAAEEASKVEQSEMKARMEAASNRSSEWEVALVLGRMISQSIDRVTVYSATEDSKEHHVWGCSRFKIYERITEVAREAIEHYIAHYPENALEVFIGWIATYTRIFESKCQGCKKILAKDSDSKLFLPPSFRCYAMAGVHPYHPQCLPR